MLGKNLIINYSNKSHSNRVFQWCIVKMLEGKGQRELELGWFHSIAGNKTPPKPVDNTTLFRGIDHRDLGKRVYGVRALLSGTHQKSNLTLLYYHKELEHSKDNFFFKCRELGKGKEIGIRGPGFKY